MHPSLARQTVNATFSGALKALYTPPGEGQLPVACRVRFRGGDDLLEGPGGGRFVSPVRLLEVRASEVESPAEGGTFQLLGPDDLPMDDDEPIAITAAPRRPDAHRLVWVCEVPA